MRTTTALSPSKGADVYDKIRRDILLGRWIGGMSLSESELAQEYGTSKTPVRDALKRLTQLGMIVTVPRRGYFVKTFSVGELRQMFAVRGLLEGYAAEQAASHASPAQTEHLFQLAAVTYVRNDKASYLTYVANNIAFHLGVAAASGNPELVRHLDDVLYRVELAITDDLSRADPADAQRDHQELVEYIAAGDAILARRSAERQVQSTLDRLLRGEELP